MLYTDYTHIIYRYCIFNINKICITNIITYIQLKTNNLI